MRFYRALFHLYPKSFRAEYGAELLAVIGTLLPALRAARISPLEATRE